MTHQMRFVFAFVLMFCVLSVLPMRALAQTCNSSASNLNFGFVAPNPTVQTDTTGTITYSCDGTVGQVVRICLNIPAGSGSNSTVADRKMNSVAGNRIQYQIYSDTARTQIWGETAANPPIALDIPIVAATGNIGSVTMYARVFAGQNLPPGMYTSRFSSGNDRAEGWYGYRTNPTNPNCIGFASGQLRRFPFDVQVILGSECTVSASDIDFGLVGTLDKAIDATGSLLANCALNTPYTIYMNMGQGSGQDSSVTQRLMKKEDAELKLDKDDDEVETIQYELYRDTARTLIWTTGNSGYSGTGTGTVQAIAVYARVPAQATPTPGTYYDTITVTMTY